MNFVRGKLYKLVYPDWVAEIVCSLDNERIIVAKNGTIFLYLERERPSHISEDWYWFLDSDGRKIKFKTIKEWGLGRIFEEAKL
jgi:hypothetical protein